MSKEEIKELLLKFGLPEGAADYYANLEMNDMNSAWLSAFRFVRPLNICLESYRTEYGDLLKSRIEKGMRISAVEAELIEKGATPELLGKFANQIALTAFSQVLYRLSDPAGSDYDLKNEGEGLPSWTIMEKDANRKVTDRRLAETHSLIPFSNL